MIDAGIPDGRRSAAFLIVAAVIALGCGTSEHVAPSPNPNPDASSDAPVDSTTDEDADASAETGGDANDDRDGDAHDSLDGADADAEGGGNDAGCVDIRVTHGSLPPDPNPWSTLGPLIGVFDDRDRIWRDLNGLHVAWNAQHGDGQAELVVSTFDATSADLVGHRFFRDGGVKGFAASTVADDGTVALAIAASSQDGGPSFHALLVFRTEVSDAEAVYPLPPWPDPNTILVGVGWDGEAFAVHGFGSDNTQYVTRIKTDGTVLLPPTAFGVAGGYADRVRYATDPVSGVSYAVSEGMWLTGHLRDGTSIPWAGVITGVQFEPQGCPTPCTGGARPVIRAFPGGAAIAGSGESAYEYTTFVYLIDQSLKATQDAIPIPGIEIPSPGPTGTTHEGLGWPTVQPLDGGWWVAGNGLSLIEYITDATAAVSRREIVTFSPEAQAQGNGFDIRFVESATWEDQTWLGFQDNTNTVGEHAYRVVLASPGCMYRSGMDEQLHP